MADQTKTQLQAEIARLSTALEAARQEAAVLRLQYANLEKQIENWQSQFPVPEATSAAPAESLYDGTDASDPRPSWNPFQGYEAPDHFAWDQRRLARLEAWRAERSSEEKGDAA